MKTQLFCLAPRALFDSNSAPSSAPAEAAPAAPAEAPMSTEKTIEQRKTELIQAVEHLKALPDSPSKQAKLTTLAAHVREFTQKVQECREAKDQCHTQAKEAISSLSSIVEAKWEIHRETRQALAELRIAVDEGTQADLAVMRGADEHEYANALPNTADFDAEQKNVAAQIEAAYSHINSQSFFSLDRSQLSTDKDLSREEWKNAGYVRDGIFWPQELAALNTLHRLSVRSEIATLFSQIKETVTQNGSVADALAYLDLAKAGIEDKDSPDVKYSKALSALFDFNRDGRTDARTGSHDETTLVGLFGPQDARFTSEEKLKTLAAIAEVWGKTAPFNNQNALVTAVQGDTDGSLRRAIQSGLQRLGSPSRGGIDLYEVLRSGGDMKGVMEKSRAAFDALKIDEAQLKSGINGKIDEAIAKVNTLILSNEDKEARIAALNTLRANPQRIVDMVKFDGAALGFSDASNGRGAGLGGSWSLNAETGNTFTDYLVKHLHIDAGIAVPSGKGVVPAIGVRLSDSADITDRASVRGSVGTMLAFPYVSAGVSYELQDPRAESLTKLDTGLTLSVDGSLSGGGGMVSVDLGQDRMGDIEQKTRFLDEALAKILSPEDTDITKVSDITVDMVKKALGSTANETIKSADAEKIHADLTAYLKGVDFDNMGSNQAAMLRIVREQYASALRTDLAEQAARDGYELSGVTLGAVVAGPLFFPLIAPRIDRITVDWAQDARQARYESIDRQFGAKFTSDKLDADSVDDFLETAFGLDKNKDIFTSSQNAKGFLEIKGMSAEFLDITQAGKQATFENGVLTLGAGADLQVYSGSEGIKLVVTARDQGAEMTAFTVMSENKNRTEKSGTIEAKQDGLDGASLDATVATATKNAMLTLDRAHLDKGAMLAVQRAIFLMGHGFRTNGSDFDGLGRKGKDLLADMNKATDQNKIVTLIVDYINAWAPPALKTQTVLVLKQNSQRATMEFLSLIGQYSMGSDKAREGYKDGITKSDAAKENAMVTKYTRSLLNPNKATALGIATLAADPALITAMETSNTEYGKRLEALNANEKIAMESVDNAMIAVVNNRGAVLGVEAYTGTVDVIPWLEVSLDGLSVEARMNILEQFPSRIYQGIANAINAQVSTASMNSKTVKMLLADPTRDIEGVKMSADYFFTRAAICRNDAFGLENIKFTSVNEATGATVATPIEIQSGGSVPTNAPKIDSDTYAVVGVANAVNREKPTGVVAGWSISSQTGRENTGWLGTGESTSGSGAAGTVGGNPGGSGSVAAPGGLPPWRG